jgi:hypothetical protein
VGRKILKTKHISRDMNSVKSLFLNILRASRKILKKEELSAAASSGYLAWPPAGPSRDETSADQLISDAAGRLSKSRLKRYSQIANITSLMLSAFGESVN